MRGSKVAETWVADDVPAILVQLGVIDVVALMRAARSESTG